MAQPEFHVRSMDEHLQAVKDAHKPVLINLWAPPGVGKSCNMAAIFNILKYKGLRAEMSPEVAKRHTYENNRMALQDAFYVAGCQEYQNFLLIGSVDFIVTDCPPGLGLLYCMERDISALFGGVMHCRQRYVNVDIRLHRDPNRLFQTYGRNHSEQQSKALEWKLDGILSQLSNNVIHKMADNTSAAEIVSFVEKEVVPWLTK